VAGFISERAGEPGVRSGKVRVKVVERAV